MASGTFKHLSPTLNSSLIASSACQKQQEQIRLDIIAAAATGTCFGRRNNSIRTTLLRKGLPHTTTSYQDPEANVTTCRRGKKKVQLSTAALIWGPATAKMHIFTWESATAKKKVKKVQLSTDALIWEPATAKNHRRCSLQVSHFHLGACHRKNVKNIQLAAVTFSPGSLPPQKKGKEGFVFNCHTHLGACHRKTVKNRQLAAVTFSPGSLPPKKKVKKV